MVNLSLGSRTMTDRYGKGVYFADDAGKADQVPFSTQGHSRLIPFNHEA
jgi:hypothetical protein